MEPISESLRRLFCENVHIFFSFHRTRFRLSQSLNTSNQSDEMLESQNNESDLVPIEESRPIFAQHIGKCIKSVI